jgi:hypothetical protein
VKSTNTNPLSNHDLSAYAHVAGGAWQTCGRAASQLINIISGCDWLRNQLVRQEK